MTHKIAMIVFAGASLLTGGDALAGECPMTESAKLSPPEAVAYEQVGEAVAISGDVAVVGSRGDSGPGFFTGVAYVYRLVNGAWTEEARLTPAEGLEWEAFGSSVSISGDVIIVGAQGHPWDAQNAGSAYIFRYNGVEWIEEATLTASDGVLDDWFGHSVAVSGDVAVVGALYEDDACGKPNDWFCNSGSAYVFRYTQNGWIEEAILRAPDPAWHDEFGGAVSISGDVIIVGAREAWAGNPNYQDPTGGSAYVFRYDGESWNHDGTLMASDAEVNDQLGGAVSVHGDVALIGAVRDSDEGPFTGSAYVFRYEGGAWTEQAKLTAFDAAAFDWFGWAVALGEDVAVIGAWAQSNEGGVQAGSAYVFRFDGTAWAVADKLTASDAGAAHWPQFGWSVAVSGDRALIGANGDDDLGEYLDSGSAYVFDGLLGCAPDCPADLNGNGSVGTSDLLELFAQWGTDGPADFDGSGSVDTSDLLVLFANWGPCP